MALTSHFQNKLILVGVTSGLFYSSRCLSTSLAVNGKANDLLNHTTKRFKHGTTFKHTDKNLDYCLELVKKCDYENYLAILLLPPNIQRAAFGLRAFNIEMAQVQEVTSQKQIAQMRMQFWKDAIEQIFQGQPPHKPAAMEIAGACKYFNLSKQWIDRMVKARASQLTKTAYTSVQDAEDFAEQINASLYYLLLECLNVKSVHTDHVASHLGKAQGLVTLVRSVPFHASQRSVMLPLDLLVRHKVSQEDIIRGKELQSVKDVIFDVASVAHQHLEKARSLKDSIPTNVYPVFLNASVCDYYLKALQEADFNVFDSKLQKRNNLLPITMYVNRFRKRY